MDGREESDEDEENPVCDECLCRIGRDGCQCEVDPMEDFWASESQHYGSIGS